MNIYDSEAVREVWQRVLSGPTETEPQMLQDWIAGEQASYRTYRALAGRGGRFAPQFRKMAEEERDHARRLSALYFLLYGQKPQVMSAAAETDRSFSTALRSAYAAELAAAKTYREAAERWATHRDLFHSLAEAEDRHARILQSVTEATLR